METIASSDRCVCNRIPCRQWCSACRFRVLHGVSVGAVVWVGPGVDVVVGVDQFFRAAGGDRVAVGVAQLVGAAGGDRHPGAFGQLAGYGDGGLGVAMPLGGHQPVVERRQLRVGAPASKRMSGQRPSTAVAVGNDPANAVHTSGNAYRANDINRRQDRFASITAPARRITDRRNANCAGVGSVSGVRSNTSLARVRTSASMTSDLLLPTIAPRSRANAARRPCAWCHRHSRQPS